jgi:hypothetical protein
MSRRSSTLGQLKILVAILVLSNIALGAFGFYFLRATDRKYSELIGQTVPTLNDMQTLTATSMEAMRSVNPNVFNDPAKLAEMAQRARSALERDRALRNGVLKRRWLSTDAKERIDFQDAGDRFSEQAAGLIPLLESGKNAEANTQREKAVRPSFDRYVAATTRAADLLQEESLRTSDMLSARTGSVSEIILGFAGWPFVALGLLIVAAIVIVLLIRIFLFGQNQEAA